MISIEASKINVVVHPNKDASGVASESSNVLVYMQIWVRVKDLYRVCEETLASSSD